MCHHRSGTIMVSTVRDLTVAVASIVILLLTGPFQQARADVRVCFASGDCFVIEGTCDGWCPDPPKFPKCTTVPQAYAPTDYLLAKNNSVWLVQGDKLTPMASDALATFILGMKRKYATADRKDPVVQQKIADEYAAFRRTDTSTAVSKARLDRIARETRLKVMYKDSSFGINQPGVK
jgi:hypothetical protein